MKDRLLNFYARAKSIVDDLVYGGPGFTLAWFRHRFRKGEIRCLVGGHVLTIRARQSDFAVLRQIFRDRELEVQFDAFKEQLERRYAELLGQGKRPVIVDAGAYIGASALWFADLYPEAWIVAIEPDPSSAALLRRNLADNPRCTIVEAAIGARAGFVEAIDEGEAWAIRTVRRGEGIAVVTPDDAVSGVENGCLFIAKIDIEGFESDLFTGDNGWIDAAEAIFVEPHDWMLPGERTSRTFQAEIGKRDFAVLINGENLIYVRNRNISAI